MTSISGESIIQSGSAFSMNNLDRSGQLHGSLHDCSGFVLIDAAENIDGGSAQAVLYILVQCRDPSGEALGLFLLTLGEVMHELVIDSLYPICSRGLISDAHRQPTCVIQPRHIRFWNFSTILFAKFLNNAQARLGKSGSSVPSARPRWYLQYARVFLRNRHAFWKFSERSWSLASMVSSQTKIHRQKKEAA